MKKILYVIIIFLILILPFKVSALTQSITLECDSFTKKVGENISCVLYGNSDEYVSAVETKLVYNDLTLSNEVKSTIWQGDYENKSLLVYTDTNKIAKFELFSFKVTSSEVGTKNLTFSDTYFTDALFVRHQLLNPNYTFTFISEEEQNQHNEDTVAVIVPDENSNGNNNSEEIENPKSGAFLPIILVILLLAASVVIFFKTKNKKIYKI